LPSRSRVLPRGLAVHPKGVSLSPKGMDEEAGSYAFSIRGQHSGYLLALFVMELEGIAQTMLSPLLISLLPLLTA